MGADVTKSLDDGGGVLFADVEFVKGAGDEEGDTVAGGLGATLGALEFDGFSCDDLGDEVSGVGGIDIGDPCHGLFVGAHIGSHDIDFRADEGEDFHGEAAC